MSGVVAKRGRSSTANPWCSHITSLRAFQSNPEMSEPPQGSPGSSGLFLPTLSSCSRFSSDKGHHKQQPQMSLLCHSPSPAAHPKCPCPPAQGLQLAEITPRTPPENPKALGCGQHWEIPQMKPPVHPLTCAKGPFLLPPGVAVPISAPEDPAEHLGPSCWAELQFWQQIYPQKTLRGAVPTPDPQ